MAVVLQGGHFDKPDRLFGSIEQSWLSASSMNLQASWSWSWRWSVAYKSQLSVVFYATESVMHRQCWRKFTMLLWNQKRSCSLKSTPVLCPILLGCERTYSRVLLPSELSQKREQFRLRDYTERRGGDVLYIIYLIKLHLIFWSNALRYPNFFFYVTNGFLWSRWEVRISYFNLIFVFCILYSARLMTCSCLCGLMATPANSCAGTERCHSLKLTFLLWLLIYNFYF